MNTLLKPLEELNAYTSTKEYIERKKLLGTKGVSQPVQISGCIDSQKCQLIRGLAQPEGWTVIVASNEIKAREMVSDYRLFDRNVWFFPAKDVIFYSADVHGSAVGVERLRTIDALLHHNTGTIVTTMTAGMEFVQSLSVYDKARIQVETGDQLDLDRFIEQLADMGYERLEQVDGPGEFSVRGGIIDIYSPTQESPVRIELFGDEIDLIQTFDVESQRSIEQVQEIEIFPASEIILTMVQQKEGIQRVEAEKEETLKKLKKAKKFDASNRLAQEIRQWKETMEYTRGRMGLESYLSYFDTGTGSFFDYFDPEQTVFFVDEIGRCIEAMDAVEAEFAESMTGRLEQGYILPGQMNVLYPATAVLAMLQRKQLVMLTMLDVLPKTVTAAEHFNVQAQSLGSYNKHFEMLIEDIKRWKQQEYRVLILSGSRTRAQRLAKDLNEYEITAFYRETMDMELEAGQVMVSYGNLRKGFLYPGIRFVVVSESDIFGNRAKRQRKRQKQYTGKAIQSFNELNVGDYVVHENHGLGIYRGIEKIKVDNITKDFVKIEYGDGGNLYVPASSLDVLQKFAGQEARKPKLNKLNSVEWKKTKSRVKGAVKEVAKELVRLYASRQEREGIQFVEDTVWQKEFEEMFPFEETQDQLDAITATKKDMQSKKVMDRLICGDVGYGKTEIAIRAAFKAIDSGRQVAFLVPTTILAQQHYNTLKNRLGDFPINIDMLSRFRTPAQQKKALAQLKKGEVDILVGTHRLLSKDVKFKNLGLLIVDEEQRFGVTHKEKIKQLKGDVDVLTLSATPIPRTLHMSLVGIRDMSVLEEPPIDRLPIQTFVMEHSGEIIREAINRELARGGQVYYVYNRVKNIDEIAMEVAQLVPDANVAFAHGQMSERELENIMMAFVSGEIDVLVATTIIETGLDISNVNTMIIDNADQLGLSQLYQLRGRVGRSNRTAYAFLMYKRDKMLKEVAEKRLVAIKEFTDLGSGIKVAMRDLEIRGAGNLLGAAQSGHMEAVGYDLYCKMLNDAVMEMKGEKPEGSDFETTVDLQVDAYIPATYIKSEFQKLDMYKRIAGIETAEELSDMEDEMTDRFGEMPKAARNLLQVALIKATAHRADLMQVVQKSDGIHLYLQPEAKLATEKIPDLIEAWKGKIRFVTKADPYFVYMMPQKVISKTSVTRMSTRPGVASRPGVTAPKKKDTAKQIFDGAREAIEAVATLNIRNIEREKSNDDNE